MTTKTTPPVPAQPSNATTGSATSQTEGSPTACASLASGGSTANKVGLLCATLRLHDPTSLPLLSHLSVPLTYTLSCFSFQSPLAYTLSPL